MKLLTYEDQAQIKVGVLCEESQKVYALSDLGWNFREMNEVVCIIEKIGELKNEVE